MTKAEFAVKLLKQYAKETGNTVRSTTDISRLEEWLIIELYNKSLKTPKPLRESKSDFDNAYYF